MSAAVGVVPGVGDVAGKVIKNADVIVGKVVTVFRVEGRGNTRVLVGAQGQVNLFGNKMLFLNFGDVGRAQAFLKQRLADGFDGAIKSFEVPIAFFEKLAKSAVPERLARRFPRAPLRVDTTKAANQFGLRQEQIRELQEAIIQGTGK